MSCSKYLLNYMSKILVETGSGKGGGIKTAINIGFKEVYSIEIDKDRYNICVHKFRNHPNVHLYLGSSVDLLPLVLEKINEKATFLLDAHVMSKDETYDANYICPLLVELELILEHGIANRVKHSILIDDTKLFNGATASFDNITLADIDHARMNIDPSMTLSANRRFILLS